MRPFYKQFSHPLKKIYFLNCFSYLSLFYIINIYRIEMETRRKLHSTPLKIILSHDELQI
jgi:hypothetical protein